MVPSFEAAVKGSTANRIVKNILIMCCIMPFQPLLGQKQIKTCVPPINSNSLVITHRHGSAHKGSKWYGTGCTTVSTVLRDVFKQPSQRYVTYKQRTRKSDYSGTTLHALRSLYFTRKCFCVSPNKRTN